MEWNDIWKIALCAITSAGGIGIVIVAAVKYISNIIAERLATKYESDLEKEREKHRIELEGKNYISKAQYDVEFEIYRSLSKAIFEMFVVFNTTFSEDYRKTKTLDEKGMSSIAKQFHRMADKAALAQNTLYENGAFIHENLYEKYDLIIQKAEEIFWEYTREIEKTPMTSRLVDDKWLDEKYESINELEDMFLESNKELRAYLRDLTVVG